MGVKHIGIIADEFENSEKSFNILDSLIEYQVKSNIPILTIALGEMENINLYFDELSKNPIIHENKVKVSIIGKWYKASEQIMESIKRVSEETKDYDKYFLNLCIDYDGREEILAAIKLIAKKVQLGKMDPELVNYSDVKENLYTSYFLPPDLIVKTGKKKRLSGFLLWDSINAYIYFTLKPWTSFSASELDKRIKRYESND